MSWRQWMAARQLLAEEFVGKFHRQAKAAEDEEFRRAQKNLQRK